MASGDDDEAAHKGSSSGHNDDVVTFVVAGCALLVAAVLVVVMLCRARTPHATWRAPLLGTDEPDQAQELPPFGGVPAEVRGHPGYVPPAVPRSAADDRDGPSTPDARRARPRESRARPSSHAALDVFDDARPPLGADDADDDGAPPGLPLDDDDDRPRDSASEDGSVVPLRRPLPLDVFDGDVVS
mmetsp:Transcript_11347/g.45966  ORF Transcript_11347/g.45966 Transcript_11347/m.45966 type:complete len:186 (+) Transcript_11347:78-635(+)